MSTQVLRDFRRGISSLEGQQDPLSFNRTQVFSSSPLTRRGRIRFRLPPPYLSPSTRSGPELGPRQEVDSSPVFTRTGVVSTSTTLRRGPTYPLETGSPPQAQLGIFAHSSCRRVSPRCKSRFRIRTLLPTGPGRRRGKILVVRTMETRPLCSTDGPLDPNLECYF